LITEVSEADAVLEKLCAPKNCIPGTETFLFGVDTESVNDRMTTPYNNWDKRFKVYCSDGNVPTHSTYNGPFVRYIQVASLSGEMFVFDMSKFPEFPKTLRHLLYEKHDDIIIAMHDAKNDARAIHRTFVKCNVSWEQHQKFSKRASQLHPENPFKCMLIDTKDIFESNIMAFHGIKYKPKGNKLSHHLELVFDQPKDADIPVGGQYWSEPMSEQKLKYLTLDAIGVVDLAITWLRHGVVPRFSYLQNTLYLGERFTLSTQQSQQPSQKQRKKIGALSTTPVDPALARRRSDIAERSRREKRGSRFQRDEHLDDSDDEDAAEELFGIYNAEPYAPMSPRSRKLGDDIFGTVDDSEQESGGLTPKGVLGPRDLQGSPVHAVAGPKQSVTHVTQIATAQSQPIAASALSVPQHLSPLRAASVPSTIPKPPVQPSIDSVVEARLNDIRTRFLCDMNNMASAINTSLSRDTVKQLEKLAGRDELENFLTQYKTHFISLLNNFYADCLISVPNPLAFAPSLPNWTTDLKSWIQPQQAATYSAAHGQFELLCFPQETPDPKDTTARIWATSGRTVIEVPEPIAINVGIYIMPTVAITPMYLSSPRFLAPEIQQFDGVDKPVVLTFLQIQDIFLFLYKFHAPLMSFARHSSRGERDTEPTAIPGDLLQTQSNVYVPPHNTKVKDLHPFLVGILSLASEEFYRDYKSTKATYEMVEQTRRLLINIIYGPGRDRLWRRAITMFQLGQSDMFKDPESFVLHLKQQRQSYFSLQQPYFDRSKQQRSGVGQRRKMKAWDHIKQRKEQRAQQPPPPGVASTTQINLGAFKRKSHRLRDAIKERDVQRHVKYQQARIQPRTPLLPPPMASVTQPYTMPVRCSQPQPSQPVFKPILGQGYRTPSSHQILPLGLQTPPFRMSQPFPIAQAPPGYVCYCPRALGPHFH